jgi:hypothetical protein
LDEFFDGGVNKQGSERKERMRMIMSSRRGQMQVNCMRWLGEIVGGLLLECDGDGRITWRRRRRWWWF